MSISWVGKSGVGGGKVWPRWSTRPDVRCAMGISLSTVTNIIITTIFFKVVGIDEEITSLIGRGSCEGVCLVDYGGTIHGRSFVVCTLLFATPTCQHAGLHISGSSQTAEVATTVLRIGGGVLWQQWFVLRVVVVFNGQSCNPTPFYIRFWKNINK